jgi:vitamin B12 transporter
MTTFLGTFIAGGEWSRAIVNDANTFGVNLADARRTDRSYFVEDRYSSDHFQLTAGVRRDDFSTFGAQTSPRLAAAVIVGGTKLRAAYGRGFRAPSIGELYYPFSGNPNLNAEHSRSFEAGIDHGPFSATIFSSTYRDLIFFDPSTFVFANIGRAKSNGLELGYKQQLSPVLSAAISYTYLEHPLPRRPRNGGSAFVSWRRGASETNFIVLRSGERTDILAVAPFSSVTDPSFTTVDINYLWHAARFMPFVKIENATNKKYEEVRGYPSPTRRAIFGVRF